MFPYGSEYTKEQIDEALRSENPLAVVPAADPDGHGTYLAGVAAGTSDEEQGFIGAAPDADLIVVRLKPAQTISQRFFLSVPGATAFQENDIMAGIRFLTQKALQYQKPLVICLGLGSNQEAAVLLSHCPFLSAGWDRFRESRRWSPQGTRRDVRIIIAALYPPPMGPVNVEILVPEGSAGFTMELWGQTPQLFFRGFPLSGRRVCSADSGVPDSGDHRQLYPGGNQNLCKV